MKTRCWNPVGALAIALLGTCAAAGAEQSLRFESDGKNGFVFNTGVLKGELRAGGKSAGLSSVVHVPTGLRLDHSMGLLGHYRVFTQNHRYGSGAWEWPSEASLKPDGSVAVRWPAAPDRPFELGATYRFSAPNAVDVETTVTAKTNLSKFESFLASYFAAGFTNSLVYVKDGPGAPGRNSFLAAEPKYGVWLVFPRDDDAMQIVRDGRWTIPPSPVDWVQMARFAEPMIARRAPDNGLTALIMTGRQSCFGVLTPDQAEGHRSAYLSLFGDDLLPGKTLRAAARLVILPDFSEKAAEEAHTAFARQANP